MSEIGDTFNALRQIRKEKRLGNRNFSTQRLIDLNIPFESKNDGIHLIVKLIDGGIVDFWPSTGLWMERGTDKKMRGVRNLIRRYDTPIL